ncbi:MAG: isoleucine--tRNA ligase [Candidatus Dojkabacteria bacterium]|jgi:isoleucyl-tRNA synthetase
MSKIENLKQVQPNVDIVKMEEGIMEFWKKNDVLAKYLKKNDGAKETFSFIDGPITANNPMGVHHAWSRTYKDIVQRYKNMLGYEQRFQNGFDCQGLWVEVGVEKDLGFNSKKDILEYGLDNFTKKCVERVEKFAGIQTEQSKRLGMFMDWDNSYYTMSRENNLYIWHFLKVCQEKGLLYKNKSATTWCPRCETGLSQHEQADGYKMVTDTALYLYFKLKGKENEYVLAWTTTPWTLTSNVLLAVNPALEYVRTEMDGKVVYLGLDAAKRLNITEYDVIDVKKELVGKEYESLFDIPAQKGVKHSIVEWDLVESTSGSEVVHIAPGCGQEDFELGLKLGADMISPLDTAGKFTEGFGELDGMYAHDVKDIVIKKLEEKGLLFKQEEYEHSYPHCWRCQTKCLFRLEDNWFIDVQSIKEDLKKASLEVKWNPDFVGKRMLGWLENMGNWMISRKRFYGLALPFYECPKCGHFHVVGGLEELKELAVKPEMVDNLESIHRPWIDEIEIKCPECGENVKRVTDVGDCWLDAGVVPFSTLKYLEDKKYWEKWFPADFITEMIEQVRLWFYSMLVFGVVLENKASYKEVLGSAELRDENNEKMSKTKPNYIKFDDAADKVGADIIRWNYAGASVGANMRFGWSILEDVRRRFYLPLWNSYNYFVTYAKLNNFDIEKYSVEKLSNPMDKWIVERGNELVVSVKKALDSYSMAMASRDIEEFVKDLSQWYIRRGRSRFTNSDIDAIGTLHYTLVLLSKLIAPFMPFVAEELYQNLVVNMDLNEKKESVHLEEFPEFNENELDINVLNVMKDIREICSNGLKAREEAKMNLRQPLAKAYIASDDELTKSIVQEELNVREIAYSKEEVKGEGLFSSGEGSKLVTIDSNLTEELKKEGLINDFMRRYRDLRKKEGLKVSDLVVLKLYVEDNDILSILKEYAEANLEELHAKEVIFSKEALKKSISVNGKSIGVEVN